MRATSLPPPSTRAASAVASTGAASAPPSTRPSLGGVLHPAIPASATSHRIRMSPVYRPAVTPSRRSSRSFFILLCKVDGFSPRIIAAPSRP